MTQREKNLVVSVLVLVLGYGGWLAWGWWGDAVTQRNNARDAATIALSEAQLREAKARASLSRLEGLRERSLPADPEIAQADYRAWLIDGLARAGLSLESIRLVSVPTERAGAYTVLPFKIQAEGDAKSVTNFLHAFYSSPATHKLTQLKLTPTEPRGRLRVDADIEAILVTGASRKSGLPEGPSGRMALASASEYVASITGRNLFAAYKPPPPPPPPATPRPVVADRPKPPPTPPFDDATQAYFTGAVGSGNRLVAWVLVRTTGERLRLTAGDELQVGLLQGRIVEVRARHLIFDADDQRLSVPLGKSLRAGTPLDADELL